MAQDYPDYMQQVTRTPIQKLTYQAFWSYADNSICPAWDTDSLIVNFPDDGLYYMIDTIFFLYNAPGAQWTNVDIAPDQGAPVWQTVSGKAGEYAAEHVVSKSGAFVLQYPYAIRFRFTNESGRSVDWELYMTYFTYEV